MLLIPFQKKEGNDKKMNVAKIIFHKMIAVALIAFILPCSHRASEAAASGILKCGVTPFTVAVTEDTRKIIEYSDAFETIMAYELDNSKNIEAKKISPGKPLIFAPMSVQKQTGANPVNDSDPVNDELAKLSASHQLDAIIGGHIDEDLIGNKVYIVFRIYTAQQKSYKTFLTALNVEKAFPKELKSVITDMVKYLENQTAPTVPASTSKLKPSEPGLTPPKNQTGKVKVETFDDLTSFGGKYNPQSNAVTVPPSPPPQQQQPQRIKFLKDAYRMIYENDLSIIKDSLRFDASRNMDKKKTNPHVKKTIADFAGNLQIKENKLSEIDKERHKDHDTAINALVQDLGKPRPAIMWQFHTSDKKVIVLPGRDMVKFTHSSKKGKKILFTICMHKKVERCSFGEIDKTVSTFNQPSGKDNWRLPSLKEFLSLDSLYVPPKGERAIYWTATKTSTGGRWVVEKEYEKSISNGKIKSIIRLSFFDSSRYDVNNCMKAWVVLVKDCPKQVKP